MPRRPRNLHAGIGARPGPTDRNRTAAASTIATPAAPGATPGTAANPQNKRVRPHYEGAAGRSARPSAKAKLRAGPRRRTHRRDGAGGRRSPRRSARCGSPARNGTLRASLDALTAWLPAGANHAFSLAIPSNPALVGFQLFSQSATCQFPAQDAFGALTNNGVAGMLGSI